MTTRRRSSRSAPARAAAPTAAPPIAISPIDLPASRGRARTHAARAWRRRLRLPSKLTLSEWADRHRVLSRESSAEPGPWRTARVPYMREIMDTISGREYKDITIVKSSQTAGTEALNNAVGYYIDQEPSSVLMIQPNVKPMAEAWSKDRLAPMLRDSARLRGKVKDPRSRDSGNTVLHKVYPGGYITVIGANSPAGLASRPIRAVLADELDRWGDSAGTEGDPLSLAEARMITYGHRRKLVKVSTPGNEGESRIEQEWAASDQRHYHVPCPHCGALAPFEWRDTAGKYDIRTGRGAYRLVWEKSVDEATGTRTHRPETARYQCAACQALISETDKAAMLAAGQWIKRNPGSDRAGFHITGFMSPWLRWRDMAEEWLRKKNDAEQRKTFFNTKLGLLYSDEGEIPDADQLESRRIAYPEREGLVLVPMDVGLLTAAVDVQGDRVELEVRGWGEGEESWQILLLRVVGDPDTNEVWQEVDGVLAKSFAHEGGASLRIKAAMIDSGYKTPAVYAFVRPRQARRVFAYKGVDNAKEPISRASKANRDGVKVFTVNPVKFKDILFGRLKRVVPGPGYLHYGLLEQTGADTQYFAQFGAEKRIVEMVNGKLVVRYVNPSKKRNEAIDLYVMNLAALRSLGLPTSQRLGKLAAEVQAAGAAATETAGEIAESAAAAAADDAAPDPATPPADAPPPGRRRRSGWMRGFR